MRTYLYILIRAISLNYQKWWKVLPYVPIKENNTEIVSWNDEHNKAHYREIFVEEAYNLPMKPDIVLDVGSNIGMSMHYFLSRGAIEVIGFEPNEKIWPYLDKNTKNIPEFVVHKAALVEHNKKSIRVSSEMILDMSFSIKTDKNGKNTIKCYNVYNVLRTYQPDTVKIDIEGYEDKIWEACVSYPTVKQIALEFHQSECETPLHVLLMQATKHGFTYKQTMPNIWHFWRRLKE